MRNKPLLSFVDTEEFRASYIKQPPSVKVNGWIVIMISEDIDDPFF